MALSAEKDGAEKRRHPQPRRGLRRWAWRLCRKLLTSRHGSLVQRLVAVGRRAVLVVYRRKSSSLSVSRWAETEGVFSNA